MPFGATAGYRQKKEPRYSRGGITLGLINIRSWSYSCSYHFKTILMEYRWLEAVLRRFNSSVSYYTDCTVILIGLPVSHVHVQRPANPHTSHIYHVYRLHTSHHHCSHSLTGEAHIDTIIVNERAAAALVLVGPAVTRVRSCKMLFDYNFKWRSDSVRGGAELDSQALDSHDRRVSREAKHAMIPFWCRPRA